MSFPCPPSGGIMTSRTGQESGAAIHPDTKSTVPKVYPDPWLERVTLSTF